MSNNQKIILSIFVILFLAFGFLLISTIFNNSENIAYANTDIITSVGNITWEYDGQPAETHYTIEFAPGYNNSNIDHIDYFDSQGPIDYTPTNAGIYYMEIVCTDSSVYGPQTLIIQQKELIVCLNDVEYTYGNPYSEDIFDLDIYGFENGEDESILSGGEIICDYQLYGDVGEYDITMTDLGLLGPNNYKFYYAQREATLFVLPRPLTIQIFDKNSTYGEEIVDLTASVYSGTIVNNDEVYELSTTASSSSSVDSYPIMGDAINDNYNVTFRNVGGSSEVGEYSIVERYITVTIDSKATTYGENPAELTYQITEGSIVDGDDVPFTLECEVTAESGFGAYNINGVETGDDDYVITFLNQTESYTVNKREVSISVDNKTSVYGNAPEAFTATVTSGTILPNHSVYQFNCDISQTTIPGIYTIYGEQKDNAISENYSLTITHGTYTVTERPISLVINNKTSEYGYDLVDLDATPDTNTPLVNNDTVVGLATFDIPDMIDEVVGTYTITGTDNSTKYAITFTNGTYTITKRTAHVNVSSQQSVYGDPILEIEAYCDDLLPSDNDEDVYTITCEVSTNHNVGTYHIYASSVNTNYNVVWTSADYVITPKPATVTVANKHSTYRDNIVLFTSSSTGILDADKPYAYKLVCDVSNESPVGTYAIEGQALTQNYAITFTNGTYTITPKGVTVTIDNKSGGYGEAIKPLTATDDGIFAEDLSGAYTLSCTATQTSNMGEYAITGVANSANYEIIFVDGVYTITQRELTLVWSNLSFTYDGTAKKPTAEVNVDSLVVTVTGEKTNAGTYTATAVIGENENYIMPTNTTIEFTIAKANPSFDLTNVVKTFEYDGNYHSVSGITGTGTISYKNNSFKDVGKYTVVVRCSESENYFSGETSVTAEIIASNKQEGSGSEGNENKSSSNDKTDVKSIVAKSDMDAGIAIWVIAGAVLLTMVIAIIVFEVIRKKNAKK